MKKFAIVSYNIYCNFTNYGSALQSWALSQAVNQLGNGEWQALLVDYCPDVLSDKDTLHPFVSMWDQDEQSRHMCELTLPAIKENYQKFNRFYEEKFNKTEKKYISENFEEIMKDEKPAGFICGSDTIFCIDEFEGFDDGYYANYSCMKNGYSVAYAASFGDSHFTSETYEILNQRLKNFKSIGLRENEMLPYAREHTNVPVAQVLDPTLLLTADDYDKIAAPRQETEKYLLLYARRYNSAMEKFAENLAMKNGWKIVEISLRATNAVKHRMFYEAGVEEFLSLVKHAEFVVTNSFHGLIFSVQYKRPFYIFSREQCNTKIAQLLDIFDLSDRMLVHEDDVENAEINYKKVYRNIEIARAKSLDFLLKELTDCK